jgi:hypothetical protein
MDHFPEVNLTAIGLDAAREVVGEGQAQEIEVTTGLDSSDQPAYYFSFLIEQEGDPMRAALSRTLLAQKIRDILLSHGDDRYPFIQVLGREDWGKRLGD